MPTPTSPFRRAIDALVADARFAFRYFARHKATTAIIITVIALGTGANTMIFSMFQAHFLRPAPAVPDNTAHVRIWGQERPTTTARFEPRGFSQLELEALAGRRSIFRDVAGWTEDEVILGGDDSTAARSSAAQFVTPDYFATLGVGLSAGQAFRQYADGTPDMTAVIAYPVAEQLYGSAAAAVGRRILVNEQEVQIVGVAAPRFQGAMRNMDDNAIWMPVSARAGILRLSPRWLIEEADLYLFARLAGGASHEEATAVARYIVTNALPDSASRVGMARTADVLAMNAPPPGMSQEEILGVVMVIVIGVLILLVAWTNVSSLMVAAAVGRRQEIAVRLALGASRPRLIRQLVTESTLLALVGSAIGLTLAWWLLLWNMKTEIDGVDLAPDPATFAFVLVMALGTGILFGLSPALHAIRGGVAVALRDSSGGASSRSRLQRGFVVTQIALSQPLLVLLGTMISLVIADYRPLSPAMSSHVISIGLRPLKTGAPGQRSEAVEGLIRRIAERPEVAAVVPEPTAFAIRGVVAGDRQAAGTQARSGPTVVHVEGVAPGWFGVVEVPIILGRDVQLGDTAAAERPVVIGTDLARSLWGDANPIGRRLPSPALRGIEQDSIEMTVVGVYDGTRRLPGMTWGGYAAAGTPTPRVYTAHGKQWRKDNILVRTYAPAAPYITELQRFVRAEAPSMPVLWMMTLAQFDEREYKDTLRMSVAVGAGGLLALLLASLGLYGVVSLAVRQRTREIGIRIAIGADPMRVARTFLASGVRVGLVALALGLPLSIAALKIGLSQGIVIAPEVNPWLIGLVIAPVLLAVASAATWVPARRAALVDPARTLRVE